MMPDGSKSNILGIKEQKILAKIQYIFMMLNFAYFDAWVYPPPPGIKFYKTLLTNDRGNKVIRTTIIFYYEFKRQYYMSVVLT